MIGYGHPGVILTIHSNIIKVLRNRRGEICAQRAGRSWRGLWCKIPAIRVIWRLAGSPADYGGLRYRRFPRHAA
ncbi:hypothetical protein KCP73_14225 [Salmonella enterica subsp. enterica]|nr:hypothetical protein KCP73_14225 [Salmonella enterica subsp. enterica]